MTSYLQQLFADVFRAQGMAEPERAAKLAEATVLAIGPLENFERDAHIYHMRGQRLTAAIIATRLGVTERLVFKVVRRHGQRRRAALRSSA